jgi:hypothetical protein
MSAYNDSIRPIEHQHQGINIADTVLQTSVKGESEQVMKGQFLSAFP